MILPRQWEVRFGANLDDALQASKIIRQLQQIGVLKALDSENVSLGWSAFYQPKAGVTS